MDVFDKLVDQGAVAALVLGVAAGAAAVGFAGARRAAPGVRAGVAVGAFTLAVAVCAGSLDRAGASADVAFVVTRGAEQRWLSMTRRVGKGGSSCLVRVYTRDGAYVGGSAHRGDCDPTFAGGFAVFVVPPGIMGGGADHALVDVWTGRVHERLAARVAAAGLGAYQFVGIRGAAVEVRAQDGAVHALPVAGGSGASVARLSAAGVPFAGGLHQATRLDAACAGADRAVVLHRDVAFGEGADLLSAVPEGGPPAWTVDLTARGAGRVLGVAALDGGCWVVSGRPGARISVLRVDGATGAVDAAWTN